MYPVAQKRGNASPSAGLRATALNTTESIATAPAGSSAARARPPAQRPPAAARPTRGPAAQADPLVDLREQVSRRVVEAAAARADGRQAKASRALRAA